jgi:Peptidase A4 family
LLPVSDTNNPRVTFVTIVRVRRRNIPTLLVALLALLVLASAGLSIQTEGHGILPKKHASSARVPIGAPQYGFGGYQLYPLKPVTSVSGEWTVPTITSTSGSGDASTWIGAQALNGAFAQVGTVENRLEGNQYYGFWSDVAKQFRPQFEIKVKPGDRVEARMTMQRSGWALTLDDLTSRTSRTIHTHYGSNDVFNSCEWFQENPVYSQFVHTNYPTLSSVTMENMMLNHTKPKFSFQDAQTLSTQNDTFFVPTHVKHDEFSLVAANGNALAFLTDVYIEDELGAAFFESATQGIEPGNVATNTYIAGLAFELPVLQSQSWPKYLSKAMDRYISNQEHLESYMQHWLQEAPGERFNNLSNVANELLQADHVADKVRSLLGLPPIYG